MKAYEPATAEADPTEASDASSTDSSPAKEELAKWQAYLGTVRKALSTFKNDDLVVDFANVDDGGSCANLKTVLEQPAKETLNVRGTYSLICNLMDEEPVSVMDLCDQHCYVTSRRKGESCKGSCRRRCCCGCSCGRRW